MYPPMRAHGDTWQIRLTLCFLRPTPVHNPNGKSIASAICTADCRMLSDMSEHALPLRIALPMGDLYLHLIRGSLGPPDSASQTVSRSVQPFLLSLRQEVPIYYNRCPLPKVVFPWGNLDPIYLNLNDVDLRAPKS